MSGQHAGREASVNTPRQVLFASLVGTAIEFFDFYIYATRGAGVSQAVFSGLRSGYGDACLAGHVWDCVSGAAHRVGALRSFWRPHWPQDYAGDCAGDDGDFHGLIGVLPTYTVHRLWRHCFWRCAALARGSGWAASGAARCCWPLRMRRRTSAHGMGCFRNSARRLAFSFGRRVSGAIAIAHRQAVFRVRLAASIPGQLGSGFSWPLRAADDHGDSGVSGSEASRRTDKAANS